MRLFHISEEENIKVFEPRLPYRKDLDNSKGLVWAITEERLLNFLTPRDCPRVTFYERDDSTKADVEKFIGNSPVNAVMAIEQKWFRDMQGVKLYIYEFETDNFILQNDIAGYYVSYNTEIPKKIHIVEDVFEELFKLNVEIRMLPELWFLFDEVKESTLGYSMCRMGFAQKRKK